MTYQQTPAPPDTVVRIGAGTALKIGFFGAIGAFLFWLILSIVVFVLMAIFGAVGMGFLGHLS